MGVATTVRDATNIERANENETRREMIASQYITMPGIPSSEKEQLEKSLRYNLWASLIRFIVLNFVLTCVWFFGFGLGFDAIKAATGQQLKGTMTVTGVVQEDGLTLSVKDPNKGKHVVYSLTDLGVDPTGWSYGGRLNTYWSKDEDSGDYSIIAVIPEKEASRIQGLEDAILMTGYFSIIVIGLLIFFVRRRKYTSWYIPFYWRMEKFCSENQIYQMYPGYNTEEAFIAYGNEHADTFSRQFAATQLTEMEKKKKKREIVIGVVSALAIMAAIILVICLGTTIQSIADNRKNDDRTVKVLEELQTAIDGGEEPLGEESERYNFANIVSRARESFPDEDVYYKLVTTDDYVALAITTKKKTNVYIDRYTPVEGAVGDLNTIYKLEISMVSNVIQPDDVLNNYTGILYK